MTPLQLHEAIHDTLDACSNSLDEALKFCDEMIVDGRNEIDSLEFYDPKRIDFIQNGIWKYATIKTELEINGIKYLKLQTV